MLIPAGTDAPRLAFVEKGPPLEYLVPAGIGDISWVYSKVRHIPQLYGRRVKLFPSADRPQRSKPFIELLPDVTFGGYVPRGSRDIALHSLPSTWSEIMYVDSPLLDPYPQAVSANVHLELGRPLASWLPTLPTDYHYPLRLPAWAVTQAKAQLPDTEGPRIGVYVSGMHNQYAAEDWRLWTDEEWASILLTIHDRRPCRFVFFGAAYDAERTDAVMAHVSPHAEVTRIVNQHLAIAIAAIAQCDYFFAYPSGLGILADVLAMPALMLLPGSLAPMETAISDPESLRLGRYRAWCNPKIGEAYGWWQREARPHFEARYQERRRKI